MFKTAWTKRHTTALVYTCVTILLCVLLLYVLLFPSVPIKIIGTFLKTLSPVIFGFAIAYLLNGVCKFYDNIQIKLFKRKKRSRNNRILSVILTMLSAAVVVAVFAWMIIPQLVASYTDLEKMFDGYLAKTFGYLQAKLEETSELESAVDINGIFNSLENAIASSFNKLGEFAVRAFEYSAALVSTVYRILIALLFAVYFLMEKERLIENANRISGKLLSEKANSIIRKWMSVTDESFGGFINGKLLDALIITLVNFVVFGLVGIPYYPLIAVVCGITDIIPYFGPFIGAIPCAFIILIADPVKVIWFAVLTLAIQQIDGNFIGPKILGEKVGVDSLLIIVAITVSGGLFGIVGMFIGVPVFAVIYQAGKSIVESKLVKKGLPTETSRYSTPQKGEEAEGDEA